MTTVQQKAGVVLVRLEQKNHVPFVQVHLLDAAQLRLIATTNTAVTEWRWRGIASQNDLPALDAVLVPGAEADAAAFIAAVRPYISKEAAPLHTSAYIVTPYLLPFVPVFYYGGALFLEGRAAATDAALLCLYVLRIQLLNRQMYTPSLSYSFPSPPAGVWFRVDSDGARRLDQFISTQAALLLRSALLDPAAAAQSGPFTLPHRYRNAPTALRYFLGIAVELRAGNLFYKRVASPPAAQPGAADMPLWDVANILVELGYPEARRMQPGVRFAAPASADASKQETDLYVTSEGAHLTLRYASAAESLRYTYVNESPDTFARYLQPDAQYYLHPLPLPDTGAALPTGKEALTAYVQQHFSWFYVSHAQPVDVARSPPGQLLRFLFGQHRSAVPRALFCLVEVRRTPALQRVTLADAVNRAELIRTNIVEKLRAGATYMPRPVVEFPSLDQRRLQVELAAGRARVEATSAQTLAAVGLVQADRVFLFDFTESPAAAPPRRPVGGAEQRAQLADLLRTAPSEYALHDAYKARLLVLIAASRNNVVRAFRAQSAVDMHSHQNGSSTAGLLFTRLVRVGPMRYTNDVCIIDEGAVWFVGCGLYEGLQIISSERWTYGTRTAREVRLSAAGERWLAAVLQRDEWDAASVVACASPQLVDYIRQNNAIAGVADARDATLANFMAGAPITLGQAGRLVRAELLAAQPAYSAELHTHADPLLRTTAALTPLPDAPEVEARLRAWQQETGQAAGVFFPLNKDEAADRVERALSNAADGLPRVPVSVALSEAVLEFNELSYAVPDEVAARNAAQIAQFEAALFLYLNYTAARPSYFAAARGFPQYKRPPSEPPLILCTKSTEALQQSSAQQRPAPSAATEALHHKIKMLVRGVQQAKFLRGEPTWRAALGADALARLDTSLAAWELALAQISAEIVGLLGAYTHLLLPLVESRVLPWMQQSRDGVRNLGRTLAAAEQNIDTQLQERARTVAQLLSSVASALAHLSGTVTHTQARFFDSLDDKAARARYALSAGRVAAILAEAAAPRLGVLRAVCDGADEALSQHHQTIDERTAGRIAAELHGAEHHLALRTARSPRLLLQSIGLQLDDRPSPTDPTQRGPLFAYSLAAGVPAPPKQMWTLLGLHTKLVQRHAALPASERAARSHELLAWAAYAWLVYLDVPMPPTTAEKLVGDRSARASLDTVYERVFDLLLRGADVALEECDTNPMGMELRLAYMHYVTADAAWEYVDAATRRRILTDAFPHAGTPALAISSLSSADRQLELERLLRLPYASYSEGVHAQLHTRQRRLYDAKTGAPTKDFDAKFDAWLASVRPTFRQQLTNAAEALARAPNDLQAAFVRLDRLARALADQVCFALHYSAGSGAQWGYFGKMHALLSWLATLRAPPPLLANDAAARLQHALFRPDPREADLLSAALCTLFCCEPDRSREHSSETLLVWADRLSELRKRVESEPISALGKAEEAGVFASAQERIDRITGLWTPHVLAQYCIFSALRQLPPDAPGSFSELPLALLAKVAMALVALPRFAHWKLTYVGSSVTGSQRTGPFRYVVSFTQRPREAHELDPDSYLVVSEELARSLVNSLLAQEKRAANELVAVGTAKRYGYEQQHIHQLWRRVVFGLESQPVAYMWHPSDVDPALSSLTTADVQQQFNALARLDALLDAALATLDKDTAARAAALDREALLHGCVTFVLAYLRTSHVYREPPPLFLQSLHSDGHVVFHNFRGDVVPYIASTVYDQPSWPLEEKRGLKSGALARLRSIDKHARTRIIRALAGLHNRRAPIRADELQRPDTVEDTGAAALVRWIQHNTAHAVDKELEQWLTASVLSSAAEPALPHRSVVRRNRPDFPADDVDAIEEDTPFVYALLLHTVAPASPLAAAPVTREVWRDLSPLSGLAAQDMYSGGGGSGAMPAFQLDTTLSYYDWTRHAQRYLNPAVARSNRLDSAPEQAAPVVLAALANKELLLPALCPITYFLCHLLAFESADDLVDVVYTLGNETRQILANAATEPRALHRGDAPLDAAELDARRLLQRRDNIQALRARLQESKRQYDAIAAQFALNGRPLLPAAGLQGDQSIGALLARLDQEERSATYKESDYAALAKRVDDVERGVRVYGAYAEAAREALRGADATIADTMRSFAAPQLGAGRPVPAWLAFPVLPGI